MIVEVTTIGPGEVVIAPASVADAVMQNVRMILLTPKGTVPLDRDFGLDFSVIDQPLPRAKALLEAEIITQVGKFEPRAEVTQVGWQETSEPDAMIGRLAPVVKLRMLQ